MNKMNKSFEDYVDNPLDLDFDDANDFINEDTDASGDQGTPQLLTLDELDKVDTIVDRTEGWHHALPKPIILKARRLSRNGYLLVNYSYKCVHYSRDIWEKSIRQTTLEDVEKYGINQFNGGYWHPRQYYSIMREYVDRKNKVYYFCFGKQTYGESMWC